MLCRKPYMAGTVPFGCGQCLPCRINRCRVWSWRQYLESLTHEQSCFVTLTYDDDHLPAGGSLHPRDLQLFLKRLRKATAPLRVRYFAVGEYGEETQRPHFHLSLFGVSGLNSCNGKPFATYDYRGWTDGGILHDAWGHGRVDCREFNRVTAQYVSGYIVKKLMDRKNGQEYSTPEFARMSNRPGIGADAMRVVARALLDNAQEWASGDVPRHLRVANKSIPLGRYLLNKLRLECGFSEAYIKEVKNEISWERSLEVLAMYDSESSLGSFKASYLKSVEGLTASLEAKALIFKPRKSI